MLCDCCNKALAFWFVCFSGTWLPRFSAITKMGCHFTNHLCSSEDISQRLKEVICHAPKIFFISFVLY